MVIEKDGFESFEWVHEKLDAKTYPGPGKGVTIDGFILKESGIKIFNNVKKYNSVKFEDLTIGDCFILTPDSLELYMKVNNWERIELLSGIISNNLTKLDVYKVSVELKILEVI